MVAVLFLILFNPACNKTGKQMEEYKIVSNTKGEIKQLILSYVGVKDSNIYYNGLVEALGDYKKIIAIHKTIIANQSVLSQLHSSDTTLPSNLEEVFKSFIGDSLFKELVKEYENQEINFNDSITSNPFNTEDDLRKFELSVQEKANYRFRDEFMKIHGEEAIPPPIIISVNFDEYEFTGDVLGKWVQDYFSALQTFDSFNNIKFVYTNKTASHISAVQRIKHDLKYIKTDSVDFNLFEGGNFLPTEKYLLVGKDFLFNNINIYSPETENELKDKFKQKLIDLFKVKDVIWVGVDNSFILDGETTIKYQPIFHIDMFLTPAETYNGKHIIFYGEIDTSFYKPGQLNTGIVTTIDTLNKLIKNTLTNIQEQYVQSNPSDSILFIPIPLVVSFSERNEDNDTFYVPKAYYSFNNALVEIYDNNRKIYLPQYEETSLAYIDRAANAAASIYLANGLNNIIPVKPAFIPDRGALHCYTKVIWRSKE